MRWAVRAGCFATATALGLVTSACGGASEAARKGSAEGGEQLTALHPRSILSPDAIAELQRALRARGFGVTISRAFDRATEDALRRYQEEQQLAATGMPDIATLRSLELEALPIYRDTLERR